MEGKSLNVVVNSGFSQMIHDVSILWMQENSEFSKLSQGDYFLKYLETCEKMEKAYQTKKELECSGKQRPPV